MTPGLIDPHTHLLFARFARGRVAAPPAGRRLSRDPRGGRRHPLDGRGDARRDDRGPAGARPALARRDARPWRHDHRGEVRLRPRPRDRDPADRGRLPARSRGTDRDRADLPRRARRAAGVPQPARGDRGLRPVDHRRAAPRCGRPRPGTVLRRLLRERRVHGRPVAADPRGRGRVTGWRSGSTPTSWRRRVARSWRPSSVPRPPTTSRRRPRPASTRSPRRRPTAARSWRRSCRRRRWFLMKDHGAPARTFIERGIPVAIGTDFNPGTSPTASLPAGDDASPASSSG